MRITMLENEYWWGGIVNLGETLPYDKDSDCELDLGTIKLSLDQSAPLFVSSRGRYIWSDKPFRIRFWHGEIRIRSDYPGGTEFGWEKSQGCLPECSQG